jgi:hypothetical protein
MSKRKVRKRRHLVEAKRAEFQQTVQLYVDSVRREIDEKLLAVSRMAALSLPYVLELLEKRVADEEYRSARRAYIKRITGK